MVIVPAAKMDDYEMDSILSQYLEIFEKEKLEDEPITDIELTQAYDKVMQECKMDFSKEDCEQAGCSKIQDSATVKGES